MSRPLPPLSSLRAFEAAARRLSFVRAGVELGVTPGAVSHQVKLLEAWVGRPLFERRTNGIILTGEGKDLAARIGLAFDEIVAATQSPRDPTTDASVKIRSQFSVAACWLAPRLKHFQALYPHIKVTLECLPQSWLANHATPDLSLFHYAGPQLGSRSDRILQGSMLPVGAPSLAAALPHRPSPADLLFHPLLDTQYINQRWTEPGWTKWFAAAGIERLPPRPAMIFNLSHLTVEACVSGAGFALLPDILIERELRDARLIQVFDLALPMSNSYFLFTPEANLVREEVVSLRNWLIEQRSVMPATA